LAIAPAPAHAADMNRHFTLQKTSLFEDGCFAPCECPVFIHDDLRGKFSLIPNGTENGYDVFRVEDVQWFVTLWDGSTTLIQGSGTYHSSTRYKLQRLELDLVFGDRPVEHYDSGLVPLRVPLPQLSITISKNGMYCRDTVFTIDAAPAPNDLRPPKLQFEQHDPNLGLPTTWGRLKKFWVD
jgi:hypothetical protein